MGVARRIEVERKGTAIKSIVELVDQILRELDKTFDLVRRYIRLGKFCVQVGIRQMSVHVVSKDRDFFLPNAMGVCGELLISQNQQFARPRSLVANLSVLNCNSGGSWGLK